MTFKWTKRENLSCICHYVYQSDKPGWPNFYLDVIVQDAYGISYRGRFFDSVGEAKRHVEDAYFEEEYYA